MQWNKNRAREKRGPFYKLSTVQELMISSAQDPLNLANSLFSAQYQAKLVNFQFGAVYQQRSKAENNILPIWTVRGL